VDTFWLRVVDVAGALESRSYESDGTLVFEVGDTFCDWNEGRWRLEVVDGRARVERTDDAPDLRVDVSDLAPPYLGAFSFTQLIRAGRVTEERPGAAALADRMFRTPFAPWCPEIF
jgi:predicted acetyltransferase